MNPDSGTSSFEPSGMKIVHLHYSALSDTLSTFNVKVSEVLAKAESEFLQAYRAHMVEVHKELQELRGKLAEAESSILKDDYIQQLERDCSWYRNEAAQLTAFVTAMDKDKNYMCRKLRALRNDRQWLSRQLKASKKQHKLLRAELEARVSAGAVGYAAGANGQGVKAHALGPRSDLGGAIGNHEVFHFEGGKGKPSLTSLPRAPGGLNTGKGGPVLGEIDPKHLARQKSAPELGRGGGGDDGAAGAADGSLPLDPDLEWRLRQQIRAVKQLVTREKHVVQQLRASIVGERLRHSELEEFFLQCTDDAKKDGERARRGGGGDGRAGLLPSTSPSATRASGGRSPYGGGDAAAEGGDELDAASAERVAIARQLLGRKDAFSLLFDQLFPPTAAEKAEDAASQSRPDLDVPPAQMEHGGALPLDPSTLAFLRNGAGTVSP